MEYHYLLLIRKADLVSLFRFGQYNIYCPCQKFSGDINALKIDKKPVEKLFKSANSFEYSMEYFILHVCNTDKNTKQISVQDVLAIYALDEDSYKLGLELNPPVNVSMPLFKEAYEHFQIEKDIEGAQRGIQNIMKFFNYDISGRKNPRGFVKPKEIQDIFTLNYKGARPQGKCSIWVYLLMYERHHNYPNDTRGCFLDALHVYGNYRKGIELDASVIDSKIGQNLMKTSFCVYNQLVEFFENQKAFIKEADKVFKGFFRIAPLYLILKGFFENGISKDMKIMNKWNFEEFVNVVRDNYDADDLYCALYLLGLVLGWDLTYKYLYQTSDFVCIK